MRFSNINSTKSDSDRHKSICVFTSKLRLTNPKCYRINNGCQLLLNKANRTLKAIANSHVSFNLFTSAEVLFANHIAPKKRNEGVKIFKWFPMMINRSDMHARCSNVPLSVVNSILVKAMII
mmetsp:Transcript_34575/g.72930  ORF Transcript_34575/g.72930 Transcript_34575/m.72930 type:complete len:122 (-) Transcript_34575:946-1311(-)